MTIYYLPYEKQFIKYLLSESGLDLHNFLVPANFTRWKKTTIHNLNDKGSKYKKLYYEFLENKCDVIEFTFILKEISDFNKFINIQRYLDVKLKPSIKNSKSFNNNILETKWTEWINASECVYKKAFDNLDTFIHTKILLYLHSLSISTGDNMNYQKQVLSFLVDKCSLFLNKDNYKKYYRYLFDSPTIYDGLSNMLIIICREIAYYLKEFETNEYNKIGYICSVGTETGIIRTIENFIPRPKNFIFGYNVSDDFKGRPYSSKVYQLNKMIQKTTTDTSITRFTLNKDFKTSERCNTGYICVDTFKLLSIYKVHKENKKNKYIDKYLLNDIEKNVFNHKLNYD